MKCFCGARGTPEELFEDYPDGLCGGSGEVRCVCGGDFCVCHNHGYMQCPGCEGCEPEDEETP